MFHRQVLQAKNENALGSFLVCQDPMICLHWRPSCKRGLPCYCRATLRRAFCGGAYPDRRWGVVQLVGHHTVNVDGEGSNPSAPAKNPSKIADKLVSDGLIPLLIPIFLAQKTDVSQRRSIY